MNTRVATLKTLNICIKAQRALEGYGYAVKIVSIDPRLTRHGCAYGIELDVRFEREIVSVLTRSGIYPGEIISGGGRLI